MNSGWRRGLVGLGLTVAAVLLSGCHAQGTFDVLSDERVAVDLTITGANLSCPHGADELKLTVTTTIDEFGDPVCHVTGETQATYFSPFGIDITPAAEYLVMQANLAGGRDSWPTADIRIRFPGKVVDANLGVVEDNSVRLTDLVPLTQGSGLRIVGVRAAGPPAWVVPALAGAGAGALLVLLAGLTVRLVRRPSRGELVDPGDLSWPPPEEAIGSTTADEAFAAATADGSEPWLRQAQPAFAAPPPEPSPGSGSGPPDGQHVDTAWFAQPPAADASLGEGDRTAADAPPGEPERAYPGSAWARPEDH